MSCLPIDPDFQKNRKKVGKEKGIAIWGPVDPPEKLSIRGTYVAVDLDICTGCGICVEDCPVQMYEWMETTGHPTSERKAFPIRELDCVQCYRCETKCPVQAIRITFPSGWERGGWERATVSTMFAQIIGGVVYGALLGPYLGIDIPFYVGWMVLALSMVFGFLPIYTFRRKGEMPKERSYVHTNVLVDSEIYAVVRHPQILGWILMMSASILISQHWLAAIIGVLISVWVYKEAVKEEKGLIIKFGDDYKRYMEKVPRMNPLLGVIRLLRRKREVEVDR